MKTIYYTLLLFATFWLQTSCVDDPEIPAAIPERFITAERSLDLSDADRFIYTYNGKAFFTAKPYFMGRCYEIIIVDLLSFEITRKPVSLVVNDKEDYELDNLKFLLASDIPFVVYNSNVFLLAIKDSITYGYLFDPELLSWERVDMQGDLPKESFWQDEFCMSSTVLEDKAYYSGSAEDSNHTLIYEFDCHTYTWKKLIKYPSSPYYLRLYALDNCLYFLNNGSIYLYSLENNSCQLQPDLQVPLDPESYSIVNDIYKIGDNLYFTFHSGVLSYGLKKNEMEFIHFESQMTLRTFFFNGKLYSFSLSSGYFSYGLFEYQL